MTGSAILQVDSKHHGVLLGKVEALAFATVLTEEKQKTCIILKPSSLGPSS